MGKHFGNLQKLKGVTYYTLSPLEINPFLMMINPGLKNFVGKVISAFSIMIVPGTLSLITYDWGMKTYHQNQRKNPDDFKDDV